MFFSHRRDGRFRIERLLQADKALPPWCGRADIEQFDLDGILVLLKVCESNLTLFF